MSDWSKHLIVSFLRRQADHYLQTAKYHQEKGNFDEARINEDRSATIHWEVDRIENGDHLNGVN